MAPGQSRVVIAACVFGILGVIVQGEVCRNNIPNCSSYDKNDICDSGIYTQWTKDNCEEFCGHCKRTTPCKDNIHNCKSFGSTGCKEPYIEWAQQNCERTCAFCHDPPCEDKLDNCKAYGTTSCTHPYYDWAKNNCRKFCGFCHSSKSITPATPTTPYPLPPTPTTPYPFPPTPSPKKPRLTGVSKDEKTAITDAINDVRANVLPPAKAMSKVKWDERIAELAQKHADKCVWELALNQKISDYGSISITMILGKDYADWAGAIKSWKSPELIFQYGKEPSSYLGEGGSPRITRYAQLVTDTVGRVGCGFSKCSDKGKGFYVCNFVTGQNLKRPYESGDRCSSCPKSCVNGLCDCKGKVCSPDWWLNFDSCKCYVEAEYDYWGNTILG